MMANWDYRPCILEMKNKYKDTLNSLPDIATKHNTTVEVSVVQIVAPRAC